MTENCTPLTETTVTKHVGHEAGTPGCSDHCNVIPVVISKVMRGTRGGCVVAICPFCQRAHLHEPYEGPRVAHCFPPKPKERKPGLERGPEYYLVLGTEDVSQKELVRAKLLT